MPKVLTGEEIVTALVNVADALSYEDADQYEALIHDLAHVLTKHCGGKVTRIEWGADGTRHGDGDEDCGPEDHVYVSIHKDANLPKKNIYERFDPEGEL